MTKINFITPGVFDYDKGIVEKNTIFIINKYDKIKLILLLMIG